MILALSILLLLSFIAYAAYAIFIKPYLRNKWYTKTYGKRCASIYYPVIGNVKFVRESFRKYGDSLKWIRDLVSKNDDIQFLIGYSNIHIVDAELAKDINLIHIGSVKKSRMMEFKELLFDQGVIFSEGEKWKKQRAILSHSFSYEVLKNRIPKINETVKMMVAAIDTLDGKNPVKISQECQKITAEVVLRSFFGDRFSEQKHEGENLGVYLTNLITDVFGQTRRISTLLPKIFLPEGMRKLFYDKEHQAVRDRILRFRKLIVDEVDLRIKDYQKDKANKDFLDILIDEYISNRAANGGNHNDSYITKESIVHQFLVFFFAGMDTTGNLSGIMIYWLANKKDVYDKVSKEVNEVFGNDKELNITDEQLKKLNYCHMFIHETLRYHCPAMLLFPRQATEDFKIGGDILVKKGMDINISLHGILRREKYFENADEFEPLRFSDENKRKLNHLAFIPFSSGPKNCIGQHMALIEAKIILVHFVRNFKITLNEAVPLRMDSNSLYSPADDRLVFLSRKEN